MSREKLTDRRIAGMKPAPAGKRYEILDAIVPGLAVRVTDRGKRTYVLIARFGGKNPTRRAIGEVGEIELAKARDLARQWLDLLDRGIDPAVQKKAERAASKAEAERRHERSFSAAVERWIAARRRDGLRKVAEDERDFARVFLPRWGSLPLEEISMVDILPAIEGIRDGGRGGKIRQSLNLGQKLATFFSWSVDAGLLAASPYRPKRIRAVIGEKSSRDRVLSDAEIRAFWRATESLGPIHSAAYRLLLLTGQRLNDVARLRWSEVSLSAAIPTLTIAANRFKSGRQHVIPLAPDAAALLRGMPRFGDCDFVFSVDGRRPVTLGHKLKQRLDAVMVSALRMDFGDDTAILRSWVNHDLRRSVRTRLSDLDVTDETGEAILGHAPAALVQVYSRSDRLRTKLDALTRWERALREIVGIDATNENIVTLEARRR